MNSYTSEIIFIPLKSSFSGLWRPVVLREHNNVLGDLAGSVFRRHTPEGLDMNIDRRETLKCRVFILIQWVTGSLSLGVKRPVREADHSPPYSAEVKEWVELYLHSPNTPSWRGA
jgi:hypothetical protein